MEIKIDLKERTEKAIELGLKLGASEVEAYTVWNKVFTVRMANNTILESKGVLDIGMGLRVISGGGLGFSATADLSNDGIRKALENALNNAKNRKLPFKYSFPEPTKPKKVEKTFDPKIAELPEDEAVELSYKMVESALEYDKRVVDNSGELDIIAYYIHVKNSKGVDVSDHGTKIEASLNSIARNGVEETEGFKAKGFRMLKDFDPEEIGVKAAETAVNSLGGEKIEPGEYTVILSPSTSTTLAAYPAFLASPYYMKTFSPLFEGKLGEKIAYDKFTVLEDPTWPGLWGSCSIDDEGVATQRIPIIENGVLRNYIYDSFYASMEGKTTTASGFRNGFIVGVGIFPGKNYVLEPVPYASNPIILPSDWKREEVIQETKEGILLERFHYTRLANPTRGDFTSVLRFGVFKIKNGEIVGAYKKSRLVDNLLNILKNVDAIADDLNIGGSWGEYAAAPTIRISKARIMPAE
ncbi:MAG: TldD/PmbA family protein [Candidatus Baldrarchaeia archaeon]